MRHLSFCVIASVVFLSGCQRNISGTYLANDNAAVYWLQLVRTPDDHLTGQLTVSVLKPDGSIDRNSVSVAGAVDGENVILSASRFLGLQTVTFSGTVQSDSLTLTGVEPTPTPFVLKRSTLTDYRAQMAGLDARSQSMLTAKADAESRQRAEQTQRNFVVQLDQLVREMQQFDSEADLHLGRFPGVEKGYHALTEKITEYVARERQLSNIQNASNTRAQLSNAATQVSFTADQLHYQGQSLQSSFEINVKPIANEATTLEEECRETGPARDVLTSGQIEARSAACSRLAEAETPFRQKYDAMSAGLAHLEHVYTQERNTQQELLHDAQRLE